jgi:hypothetical protein
MDQSDKRQLKKKWKKKKKKKKKDKLLSVVKLFQLNDIIKTRAGVPNLLASPSPQTSITSITPPTDTIVPKRPLLGYLLRPPGWEPLI